MESKKPQAEPSADAAPRGLPARLWARAAVPWMKVSRRARIAILAGTFTILANLGLVLAWLHFKPSSEPAANPKYLARAMAALDRGAFAEAKRLATLARDHETLAADQAGGPDYVLGAVATMEADTLWEEDQRRYDLLAARYLSESQQRGFPPDREGSGLFLLGKSLCLSRQYDASREVLEKALKQDPEEASEIHRLAAQAYLSGAHPDLKRAMAHNDAYLADKQLDRRQRFEGLLVKGEILFKQGSKDDCLKVLAGIPPDVPSFADAIVLRGQLLMQAAEKMKAALPAAPSAAARHAVQQKYQEAISTLRQAQNRGSSAERIIPQSMYLIGECFLAMEDWRAALDQFHRTRQGYPESIEGVAAAFHEADLLRKLDDDDEALAAYRRAVAGVGDPAEYRNPLLSLDGIRQRLLEAYQFYVKAGRFEKALTLSGSLYPLFPHEREVELAVEARQGWAASLNDAADKTRGAEGRELAKQARAQLRLAGAAYAHLADLQMATRAYPEDVWNSSECLLAGHDFRGAVRMLDEYLRYELRHRRPRALLNMGEAQLALQNIDKALEALQECITSYPSDPSSYRARLLAAKAHVERGETKEAETLLRKNLEEGYINPKSLEWRDSLYEMGCLLQAEGRDEEAIPRLEEFAERYPDSPEMIEAHYLIAEAYRRSARVPRERLETDTIETSRIAHNKQMQRLLSSAIAQYDQVQDLLTRREEQQELDPLERAILRNCYFARGAAYYDMGRYDDAIRAYSAVTNHYQHQPEVLEALMQIAACYRRLGKPDEARGTLEQAKVMWARIRPDAPFTETTNYTRDEWKRVLNWYASL